MRRRELGEDVGADAFSVGFTHRPAHVFVHGETSGAVARRGSCLFNITKSRRRIVVRGYMIPTKNTFMAPVGGWEKSEKVLALFPFLHSVLISPSVCQRPSRPDPMYCTFWKDCRRKSLFHKPVVKMYYGMFQFSQF